MKEKFWALLKHAMAFFKTKVVDVLILYAITSLSVSLYFQKDPERHGWAFEDRKFSDLFLKYNAFLLEFNWVQMVHRKSLGGTKL